MRDGRPEGIEAAIKRWQRVARECDDGRLPGLGQEGRTCIPIADLVIIDRLTFASLGSGLEINFQHHRTGRSDKQSVRRNRSVDYHPVCAGKHIRDSLAPLFLPPGR